MVGITELFLQVFKSLKKVFHWNSPFMHWFQYILSNICAKLSKMHVFMNVFSPTCTSLWVMLNDWWCIYMNPLCIFMYKYIFYNKIKKYISFLLMYIFFFDTSQWRQLWSYYYYYNISSYPYQMKTIISPFYSSWHWCRRYIFYVGLNSICSYIQFI